jgi:hypothetical protein
MLVRLEPAFATRSKKRMERAGKLGSFRDLGLRHP